MRHILVIDDDTTFVAVVRAALDPVVYAVDAAKDGVEGLEKVENERPDLILLDIRMPNMNGIEFLKELTKKYGNTKPNVLITSNIATLEQVSEGVALGIRGYVVKSDESLQGIAGIIGNVFNA